MALQKGLVGHWTMNSEDTDNGKIRDRSAYDNHGTLNGPTTGQFGLVGESFDFNGNDDIDVGNLTPVSSGTNGEYSICVWVKFNSISSDGWIFGDEQSANGGIMLQWDKNNNAITNYKNGYLNTGHTPTTGNWEFYVMTQDANGMYFSVDGNTLSKFSSKTNVDTTDPFYMGEFRGGSRGLNGQISNCRIYNRALSQSEITQLYNQRSTRAHKMQKVPVAQQDLVAHYPFASPGATDQSGNGNDGTNNGATYIENGGVKGSGAYDFNGSGNYIGVSEKTAFGATSISGWFKGGANGKWGGLFAHGANLNTSNGGGLQLRKNDSDNLRLNVGGWDGSNHISYNSVDWSKWTFAAGTWDGSQLKLYINGQEVGSATPNQTVDDLGLFEIGRYTWADAGQTYDYSGQIDDVRIYNRALSKYEVKRLYQSEGNVFGGRIRRTVYQGNDVVVEEDQYGTWLLVMNYEHYGGEDPESQITPGSTFPQMPNGVPKPADVESLGTSGELKHVDQISQYGITDVSAVRLEGETSNHDRKINYFTENQTVIDAVVDDSTKAGGSALSSQVTKYSNHTAKLPDAGGNETSQNTSRIFGYEFPIFQSGQHHWAMSGNGNRWEVDDYPGDASKTTIHRVWVRI